MNGHLPGRGGMQTSIAPGESPSDLAQTAAPLRGLLSPGNHRSTTTGRPPRTSDPLGAAVREPTPRCP